MLATVFPEEIGVRSSDVYTFLSSLERRKLHMHSLLLMRGDKIFFESYWAPFHKDRTHRMYSVTKSFVSVAIGLAEEDALLSLDAPIATYFPEKIDAPLGDWLGAQTVREMLTMTTVSVPTSWFEAHAEDRTRFYFTHRAEHRPAGTLWEYDSAGSQVLSALVEKVTGKRLFDYLNERIFKKIGAFEHARMLSTPNGDTWGDSAMICTPRDLAAFARFVLNYGTWNGERLMNERYLRTATSKVVHNVQNGHGGLFYHGYGYQFWITEDGGFVLNGMGDQFAICLPKQDLIMVCTADNQGNEEFSGNYIAAQWMDCIAARVCDTPLAVNPKDIKRLCTLRDGLTLFSVTGTPDSPMRSELNGVTFVCHDNPLSWKRFSFTFEDAETGELRYTNARGEMALPFHVNRNFFGKFPEEGYSRECGGVRTTDGHRYDDAVSLAWLQDDKLLLFAQIIDDYFGNLSLIFSFKEHTAVVKATRSAEDFLWDYKGTIIAERS